MNPKISIVSLIIALALTSSGGEAFAQPIQLKKAMVLNREYVVGITDMDRDGEAELIIQRRTDVRFLNGKTFQTIWTIPLDSTKGESLFTEELTAPRVKDKSFWKDYNGNGVLDVLIGGGDDDGGYIRFVDVKTGEDLLRMPYIPFTYTFDVADVDRDGFFDIVLSRDDSLIIYSTLAKVAGGGVGIPGSDSKRLFGERMLAAPNPSSGAVHFIGSDELTVTAATVYSSTGDRIAELGATKTGVVAWDGATSAGRQAPSGSYYVLIRRSDGSTEVTSAVLQR